MAIRAGELAKQLGGALGPGADAAAEITGISDLAGAVASQVSFILSPKYAQDAEKSAAGFIISDSLDTIAGKGVIKVKNAKLAYIRAIKILCPAEPRVPGISGKASVAKSAKLGENVFAGDFAVIGENAVIGQGAVISENCVIGKNCSVGKNTVIHPNVSVYPGCIIGDNCIIHSGVVIGADGFAFEATAEGIVKVPQIGSVRIGNNVEIGSNSAVDRAAFGETVIGNNVKIDNLVMIAHNVKIGDNTIVVAQTGIAGSSTVGTGTIIGGQVGVADHVNIGNNVQIGSQSGISKDTGDNVTLSGTPARGLIELRRSEARVAKLEEFFNRIKEIEKILNIKKDKK